MRDGKVVAKLTFVRLRCVVTDVPNFLCSDMDGLRRGGAVILKGWGEQMLEDNCLTKKAWAIKH